MKYFIVADVHGYFNELMKALDDAGFDKNNPEHFFVSLGDLLDRGRQPKECLEFVNSLERKILIRGNHEDLMEAMLDRMSPNWCDNHNGTYQTIIDLTNDKKNAFYAIAAYKPLFDYLNSCVNYAEVGDNIFVHGWIPCNKLQKMSGFSGYEKIEDWRNSHSSDFSQCRWINGMDAWNSGAREDGKTIFCGHWHTSWGHSIIDLKCSEFGDDAIFEPFVKDGIVALDTCTAHTGKINCYVVEVPDALN